MSTSNKKLQFKEYYLTKKRLMEAGEKTSEFEKSYQLRKYCRFPISENGVKRYIKFSPQSNVSIKWRYNEEHELSVIGMLFEDEEISPTWNNKKLINWIFANTIDDGIELL